VISEITLAISELALVISEIAFAIRSRDGFRGAGGRPGSPAFQDGVISS
jgi:hypothetical protein